MTTDTDKPVEKPVLHQPAVLKPKEGKPPVRKEDGKYLPEGGDTVIFTAYWARRLDDGDVEFVTGKAKK